MKDDYRDFNIKIPKIFLVCLFGLLLPVSLFAQEISGLSSEQKIQKAKEHYLIGKEFIKAGDYHAADSEFKKAQQLLEEVSPVKPKPAEVSQSAQIPVVTPVDTAKPIAVAAVSEVKPPSLSEAGSLAVKAKELDQKDQFEEAIALYLKAISLEPKNASLHYNLAVEYLKANQFSLAEETFKKVIQLNPKDKDAYYNLAVLYESYIIDKSQAIKYYTKYLRLAPGAEDADKVRTWIRQIKKEISKQ